MSQWNRKRLLVFALLAGLVFIGGVAGFVGVLVTGLKDFTEGARRFQAPGAIRLNLPAGSVTVFHETGQVVNGQITGSGSIFGLRLDVTDPGGRAVDVTSAQAGGTYNLGSLHGVAIMQFSITQPGDHRIQASFNEGPPDGPVVLSLIPNFTGRLLRTIFLSIAVMLGGFLGAGIFVTVGIITGRIPEKSLP